MVSYNFTWALYFTTFLLKYTSALTVQRENKNNLDVHTHTHSERLIPPNTKSPFIHLHSILHGDGDCSVYKTHCGLRPSPTGMQQRWGLVSESSSLWKGGEEKAGEVTFPRKFWHRESLASLCISGSCSSVVREIHRTAASGSKVELGEGHTWTRSPLALAPP
jgi:hypothetical protein